MGIKCCEKKKELLQTCKGASVCFLFLNNKSWEFIYFFVRHSGLKTKEQEVVESSMWFSVG